MMQKLFDHMEQDHGLSLTESELQDIVSSVGCDVRLLLDRLEKSRDEWRTIAGKFRAVFEAGSGAHEDLACEEYDRMIKTMNPTTTNEQAQAKHEAELAATLDDLRPYSAAEIEELKRTTLHGPAPLFRLITTVADRDKRLAAVRAGREEDEATIFILRAKLAEVEAANAELRRCLEKIAHYDDEPIWSDDRDDAARDMLGLAQDALAASHPSQLLAVVRALAEALKKWVQKVYMSPMSEGYMNYLKDAVTESNAALTAAKPYLP